MALHWTEEGRPPVVFVRLFSGAPGSGADFGMRPASKLTKKTFRVVGPGSAG